MIKLAVIGDPIEHSLSPLVHGGVMDALGLDYAYEKVQVKKGELPEFLSYAKRTGISGFNVTMPHKIDIIPYLDTLDEEASLFGAVNTVKIQNGRFWGYNTDAKGYELALKSKGYSLSGSRVVILGAGGVVRTLALKAASVGASEIRICNRTLETAKEIAESVHQKTGVPVYAEEFLVERISEIGKDCNILMNATPLGMSGVDQDFEDLSFLDTLPSGALVSDLIYRPDRTRFLQKAERLGLSTLNGLGMLIYQGILADEIYLNCVMDQDKIFESVAWKMKKELGYA